MLNNGHILTSMEMRAAEEQLIRDGISVEQLMDRAGTGAGQYIWRSAVDMPTLIFCGPGNNGGDGYVIAEWLRQKGVSVEIATSGDPRTDAAKNAKSLWKGKTLGLDDAEPRPQFIDCLFGTGLTREIDDALWVHYHRLASAARRRVAIDLPSGVTTDGGELLNDILPFQMTIALGAYKPAHFLAPAAGMMGDLVGVDIGVRMDSQFTHNQKPKLYEPAFDNHKYSRGLVAVIAGEMPGAAELAARACQHSGAGYVKLFSAEYQPLANASIVQTHFNSLSELQEQLADERINVVLVGPGLGRSNQAEKSLDVVRSSGHSLVMDADALHVLGSNYAEFAATHSKPVVATPHGGEFERIAGNISGLKLDRTRKLATQSKSMILHKGPDTIMAAPDGSAKVSSDVKSWLSIAGTGDVLAGLIAGRLAISGKETQATYEGQWLHSRAAALAGAAFSPERLIEMIPAALAECL